MLMNGFSKSDLVAVVRLLVALARGDRPIKLWADFWFFLSAMPVWSQSTISVLVDMQRIILIGRPPLARAPMGMSVCASEMETEAFICELERKLSTFRSQLSGGGRPGSRMEHRVRWKAVKIFCLLWHLGLSPFPRSLYSCCRRWQWLAFVESEACGRRGRASERAGLADRRKVRPIVLLVQLVAVGPCETDCVLCLHRHAGEKKGISTG